MIFIAQLPGLSLISFRALSSPSFSRGVADLIYTYIFSRYKIEIDPVTASAAASLMGARGGTVMSEKKRLHMERLRQMRIAKTGGKKKGYRAKSLIMIPPVTEEKLAMKAAREALMRRGTGENKNPTYGQIMGFMGGSVKSEKKIIAARKNGLSGGRKRLYKYDRQVVATMGSHGRNCVIPDEVAANPDQFKGISFAAYSEGKRVNVRVISADGNEIHVRRF